jgi:tellurite resistance protein TehA-like permease
VFPLGMYSVATLTFGKITGLAFMHPIAHVMLWVAVAAWVLVAAAFLIQLVRSRPPAPASAGAPG